MSECPFPRWDTSDGAGAQSPWAGRAAFPRAPGTHHRLPDDVAGGTAEGGPVARRDRATLGGRAGQANGEGLAVMKSVDMQKFRSPGFLLDALAPSVQSCSGAPEAVQAAVLVGCAG